MGQKSKNTDVININSDNEAEKMYKKYKYKDPFPSIESALLNSDDLRKYVQKTGMIYPFNLSEERCKNDEWVTYPIKIGDKCYYWDDVGQFMCVDLTDKENGEFELKKNSIVFVELEPMFRVPYYIVLRFNLKIKHIYKGLLLGTGPIIDPGFQGKIYIPLHNFTSNNYKFRRGEELIEMEFTKISLKKTWRNAGKNNDKKISNFCDYIQKALKNNIHTEGLLVVKNALPVEIKEQQEKLKGQDEKIEEQSKILNKEIEESKKFRDVGIIAGITATLAICISISSIHVSESARYDSLTRQTSEYKEKVEATIEQLKDYKKTIDFLEDEIKGLKEKIESTNSKKMESQLKKGDSSDG